MSGAYSPFSSVTCDYIRSGVQADRPELHVFCFFYCPQHRLPPHGPPCACWKGAVLLPETQWGKGSLGPRNLPQGRAPVCWWPPRNTVPSGDVWVIPYQVSPSDDTSQGTDKLNPFFPMSKFQGGQPIPTSRPRNFLSTWFPGPWSALLSASALHVLAAGDNPGSPLSLWLSPV